jgi:virginiamycin B lyase
MFSLLFKNSSVPKANEQTDAEPILQGLCALAPNSANWLVHCRGAVHVFLGFISLAKGNDMNRNLSNVFVGTLAGALMLFGSPALANDEVGSATEFAIPSANAQPVGIAVETAKTSNVWYTESANSIIAVATPTGTKTTEYTTPTSSSPAGIAQGSDGAMWFCEQDVGQIGRIDSKGSITEYALGASTSVPQFIALGSDGNMYFTELIGNNIGVITPKGVITEYAIPTAGAAPVGIVEGPDKAVWFAENGADQIGRIDTAGNITEYPVTAGTGPNGIALGRDGNIWYTELFNNAIGVINVLTHVVTDYPLPTPGANPQLMAVGRDNAVWFTEVDVNQVGRITTHGKITEYTLPTANSGPLAIGTARTAGTGTDRNYVYVGEQNANQIARVVVEDDD